MSKDIDEELIKSRSGHFDLELVTILDLMGCGIGRISNVSKCVNVIDLKLSNNRITSCKGLKGLEKLQNLDLSNNDLRSLDFDSVLPALQELRLQGNRIEQIDFDLVKQKLPSLQRLILKDKTENQPNPVCEKANYFDMTCDALPNLRNLDGEVLEFRALIKGESNVYLDLPTSFDDILNEIEEESHGWKNLSWTIEKMDPDLIKNATKGFNENIQKAKASLEGSTQDLLNRIK